MLLNTSFEHATVIQAAPAHPTWRLAHAQSPSTIVKRLGSLRIQFLVYITPEYDMFVQCDRFHDNLCNRRWKTEVEGSDTPAIRVSLL